MTWAKRRRWLIGFGAIALVTGCFNDEHSDGGGCGNGLAHSGNFAYECVGEADPHCDGVDPIASVPGEIARGASFRLRFNNDGVAGTVQSVSSKAARKSGDEFTVLRAGNVGFVVNSGAEAVDALRVTIVEPANLIIAPVSPALDPFKTLRPREPLATFTLRPRQVTEVRAFAVEPDGGALAGTVRVDWTIDPPDIAKITPGAGTCRVEGQKKGEALLTASDGTLRVGVVVRVTDDMPPDAGNPNDAGTDADALDGGDDGGDS